MGLESANYFISVKDGWARLDEVLLRLGAERRDAFAPGLDRWIIRGERYWIDLMGGKLEGGGAPAISVRVALCNPPDVELAVRHVLAALMNEFNGQLYDVQTSQSYRALDDASWAQVQEAFAAKRAQFRKYFGSFEAAMSGEDVFPRLDELRRMN